MGGGCDCPQAVAVGPFRITRGDRTWIALPTRSYDPSLSGPPPAGCGASYADSLYNAGGGRTMDDPFDKPWCGQTDTEAWKAQADYVAGLVRAAWNALMARANAAREWTETTRLDASVTAYENEHATLPEPSFFHALGAGGCAGDAAAMQSNIRNGACQLEQLNTALARMGGSPIDVPYTPPPEPSPLPWAIGGGIALAALVALAIFAWKK